MPKASHALSSVTHPDRTPKFTFRFSHRSIGYAQWQVDRSQDEVFLATQEAAGQHRDAQGKQNKHHTEAIDKEFTVNPIQNVSHVTCNFEHSIHKLKSNRIIVQSKKNTHFPNEIQDDFLLLFTLNVDHKFVIWCFSSLVCM